MRTQSNNKFPRPKKKETSTITSLLSSESSKESEYENSTIKEQQIINEKECPTCHKLFKNHKVMLKHKLKHRDQSLFKCDKCFLTFPSQQILDNHNNFKHDHPES